MTWPEYRDRHPAVLRWGVEQRKRGTQTPADTQRLKRAYAKAFEDYMKAFEDYIRGKGKP